MARDWQAALAMESERGVVFDLCLVDPPYSLLAGISESLPRALAPVLAEYATVIIEGPVKGPVPTLDGIRVIERTDRSYGSTRVSVMRTNGAQ